MPRLRKKCHVIACFRGCSHNPLQNRKDIGTCNGYGSAFQAKEYADRESRLSGERTSKSVRLIAKLLCGIKNAFTGSGGNRVLERDELNIAEAVATLIPARSATWRSPAPPVPVFSDLRTLRLAPLPCCRLLTARSTSLTERFIIRANHTTATFPMSILQQEIVLSPLQQ